MDHVYWVTPLLGGRCGPVRCPWNLSEFYRAGVRTIVSLDDQVKPQEITASSLEHIPLYLPDVALTTLQLKQQFLEAVPRFIDAVTSRTTPVIVHCYAGNDRTGAMLACYLVHQKIPSAQAISQIRTLNPSAMITPGYTDVVHLYTE